MIYFDNAATSGKKPQEVIDSVKNALIYYNANPGRSAHKTSVKTAEAVYNCREKISDFFGASGPERVVFTLNCTHSINCVLKGVLKKGDHIIVSSLEHNAVMRPLTAMGINYSIAEVSLFDDNKTLAEIKKLIKPNTKMIFCTGASNVIGKILPIKEIGQLAHSNGILFGLDGAQVGGILPINMREMNIDYLAIAPHKGLYAPTGIGILICEKGIENTILQGGTGTNSLELTQPESLPEKLESGTLNILGIMGVSAGIDFVKKIGIKKIYSNEMMLAKKAYEFLKNNGFSLYTPSFENGDYVPVISFNLPEKKSEETALYLAEKGIAVRGGYHCAPLAHKQIGTLKCGTVRLSFSHFNSINEIIDFERIMKLKKR